MKPIDGVVWMLIAGLLVCAPLHAQAVAPPKSGASLSDHDEVRIGELLADKYAKLAGLQSTPQTVKIDKYLQTVGERLAAHAQRELPYRFHYDPDPWFKSAVALPGGQVFVGAGILSMMDTEDQLAAVLGHEMKHVALNQCRDRLIEELAKRHLTAETAEDLKVQPFFQGYGHDREFAADREGVRLAAEAGYSPEGAIRLLKMFAVLAQQMPNTPTEDVANLNARIAQIQQMIETEKLATPKEKPLVSPLR